MKTKHNHAFTLIELLVVITIIAILASLAVPAYNGIQRMGNQTKGVNNCKQIILSLKQFSKDNNSQYPDTVNNTMTGGVAATANDAFRFLIQEQIISDERIFGCPAGYNPDNNIGTAPGYGMALMPNENHWAMTGGQTDATQGNMPLVFENPVSQNWPPQWNADVAGQIRPGRTWPGGEIIVGRNDGSVQVEKLNGKRGTVGPKVMAGGMDSFTQASQGVPQRVLNAVISGGTGMGTFNNPDMGGLGQPGGLPGGLPGQGFPGGAPGGFQGQQPFPGGAPGGFPGGAPGGLPAGPGGPLPGGLPGNP